MIIKVKFSHIRFKFSYTDFSFNLDKTGEKKITLSQPKTYQKLIFTPSNLCWYDCVTHENCHHFWDQGQWQF